ncbi:hypothetical protein PIB30_018545 [Stylosanthes scabra]|uniref:GB1/RHD3-type G domain-containing protein n=1 Tax=Stylosanthes scabra TaxID=79078 RepID=A0ABU6Z5E3_9FABA|nr:hypothetical protein [Stylosanthes scabra]
MASVTESMEAEAASSSVAGACFGSICKVQSILYFFFTQSRPPRVHGRFVRPCVLHASLLGFFFLHFFPVVIVVAVPLVMALAAALVRLGLDDGSCCEVPPSSVPSSLFECCFELNSMESSMKKSEESFTRVIASKADENSLLTSGNKKKLACEWLYFPSLPFGTYIGQQANACASGGRERRTMEPFFEFGCNYFATFFNIPQECSLVGDELQSAGTPVHRFSAGPCYATQLVDKDAQFCVANTESFVEKTEFDKCGQSYAIVSIIGPQSSGKSTLLNCLFGTNFEEMKAEEGRHQVTRGIWIARCAGIEPCTLVLDVEGTDGKENADRDDTSFERQSALFALAVSDIVLINMWSHGIGLHIAANRPLLKTVFQIKMKLFTPRKITLLFVIRDKSPTPFEKLKEDLLEDIWESFTEYKPDSSNEVALSEIFSVEVVSLSNYEHKEEQFKEEVVSLRQQIFHSIAQDKLARDLNEVVHASDFTYSSQEIWEKIKADKDLDLPSHKVMVATVRCEKISREKYENFAAKEEWDQFEEDMNRSTTEFLNRLNSQIDACLSEYDAETTYYDEGPRSTYKNQLKEKLLQLSEPALVSALERIASTSLDEFKNTFQTAMNRGKDFYAAASSCIESCLSNFDKAYPDVVNEMSNKHKIGLRKKLQCDIVSVLTSSCKEVLKGALSRCIEKELFGGDIIDPWKSIREVLKNEVQSTGSRLFTALIGLVTYGDKKKMTESLEDYARGVVEEKVRDEAKNVLMQMKMCFESRFVNRLGMSNDDIPTAANSARHYSLTLLSILAAIRLDDDDTDDIKEKLEAELLDSSSSANRESRSSGFDPLCLDSDSWEQIPSCRELIGPRSCKRVWDQFMQETEIFISKAVELTKSSKSSRALKVALVLSLCVTCAAGGAAATTILGARAFISMLAVMFA